VEITLDKKSKTEGLLTVRLARADYQSRVEEKIKEYARRAHLKGFRQGKVPTGLIRRMYGKAIALDEINNLLSRHISEYIREKRLNIVGDPMPLSPTLPTLEWDVVDNIEVHFRIGMADDFTCEISDKIKLNRYRIEVTDKDVEHTIDNLRKRFARSSYPEVSEPGDDLMGNIRSEDGSMQFNGILKYEWLTPAGRELVIGRKKDDEFTITYPDIFESPELAARMMILREEEAVKLQGDFRFKVITIIRTEPAPLTIEFFERVFGKGSASTEEEFRHRVREALTRNHEQQAEEFLHRQIEEHLITHTKISLPEDFLRSWLKSTGEGKITDEVLDREFSDFLRSLKWRLIRKKIMEDNQLWVTDEEVKSRAREILIQEFGNSEALTNQLDNLVINYLSHENGRNYTRLYEQLERTKIMAFITGKIKLQEKAVTAEEFGKIVEKK
jgi:trigger factor